MRTIAMIGHLKNDEHSIVLASPFKLRSPEGLTFLILNFDILISHNCIILIIGFHNINTSGPTIPPTVEVEDR